MTLQWLYNDFTMIRAQKSQSHYEVQLTVSQVQDQVITSYIASSNFIVQSQYEVNTKSIRSQKENKKKTIQSRYKVTRESNSN